MAYPRQQFQQAPSSQAYSDRQAPHLYQEQQQHAYQHVPQGRNRHETPYQDPPSRSDRNIQESYSSARGYGSTQWPEQSAEWSSEADQPYRDQREYAGPNPSHMRPGPGAHQDHMNEPYDSRRPPANPSYSQNQNMAWSARSPQIRSQQPQSNQPRGHGPAPHSINGYDGAGPPARVNGHHAPQQDQRSNGYNDRTYHDPPVQHDPQSQFAQQQRPRPTQDGVSEKAGWDQRRMDPHAQQRLPNSSSGRPQNSTKEKLQMNPLSPDNISWDNPFPTFPKGNKKSNRPGVNDLNHPMANTSIADGTKSRQAEGDGPLAAGKQTNYDSSRNNEQPLPQKPSQDRIRGDIQYPLDRNPAGGRMGPSPHYGYDSVRQPFDQRAMLGEGSRPRTDHGRHSEDRGDYGFHRPGGYQGDTQRSKTMPNNISEVMAHTQPPRPQGRQVPIQDMQHRRPNEHAGSDHQGPPHPQMSNTQAYPHSQSFEERSIEHYQDADQWTPHPPSHTQHSQQSSLGDFFDSYYHSPHYSDLHSTHKPANQPRSPPEEDMPNFDQIPATGASHMHGLSVDDQVYPQQQAPAMPQMPRQPGGASRSPPIPRSKAGFAHSKSSPNLREQPPQRTQQYSDGFDFELPGSVPAMYSPGPSPVSDPYENPSHNDRPHQRPLPPNSMGHPLPASVRSTQSTSRPGTSGSHNRPPFPPLPDGQSRPPMPRGTPSQDSQSRSLRNGPSPIGRHGPTSPPVGPPSKPDSLPAHPAPVRAGLMDSPPANQASRPAPVRQYSAGLSSHPQTSSSPRPQISRPPPEKSGAVAVTHQELERLRQSTRNNPSDRQTQLLLAKKLVGAASVLADDGGRADAKTAGKNRERFNSESHKLVKKLIQNGYPEATFYLGDCYSRGLLGLETDPKEAFGQYQSAAKAGHAQAAYRVAVCCEMGLEEGGGTKRDAVKAMQWYQRAATLGDTPAMYKMGVIQLKGLLGQPKSASAALSWLQRAAKQADKENPHALHELALLYESPNSIEGLRQDDEHAKQLFMEAANLGYKFSQFRLGCAFEYGLFGCPIDPRQSIAWYSKAAVQDEHQSELALSGWYLTGSEGVLQQSDTEAYLWARKAAQAGLAKAEYAMGYFTEVGIGAPANIEDAKRWYWKSASQNFPKARERLEDLRRGGAKMQKTRVSRSKINKQSEGECVVM
ncbi:MAG: hypothetical protein Q9169_002069 [Polycauliona sp. 2 TL-2023]